MPIIIRPSEPFDSTPLPWTLIAGERRLTASKKLGLELIPTRLGTDLSPLEHQLIELEENVKRKDLSWQEEVQAVEALHKILESKDEDWTQRKTADYIGISYSNVSQMLRVSRDLNHPQIIGAVSYTAANNILARMDERRNASIINSILESGEGAFSVDTPDFPTPNLPVPTQKPSGDPESILKANFLEWAPAYSGPRFTFIHMDPPYGINAFGGDMSGRKAHHTYNDSPDVYWKILKCLCDNLDRLMTPKGHLMLWFSMEYYTETLDFFAEHAPSLDFVNFPLIWFKSDNDGIVPDVKRQPRRVYETALMASREDQLLVRPFANLYPAPTNRTYHPSTKPEPMLRHFFQMFVDDTTRLLDPTCGSGSALRAAESLGAEYILGLEQDPTHFENAKIALTNFRNLRRASGGK
jgi:ParB/RepB/Spo0J family partition protein